MVISLDTETCAWLDRPGWQAPPLVCISVSDGQSTYVVHRSDDWQSVVRAALARGVVGHNVAFDFAVLAAAGFPLEEIFDAYANDRITCTMAREKLLDIYTGEMARQRKPKGPGYALDVLCKRRLGVELDKTSVRLEYERLLDVPVSQWPPAFREYAANDALYTWQLAQAQETAEGAPNLVDQYRQARGAFWIQLMRTWGTTVDLNRLGELRARYEADFAAAGRDLVAAGLAREKRKGLVRNVKVAGARLVEAYARQGKVHPTTEHGAPDLSRESCENANDPALLRYSEYMSLSSKVTKEIPALSKPLIHAYYDALVETGRTSCSGPNLQNLPRKGGFRECLVPRPGNVFVCADFSGFELATLAQVCLVLVGYSRLADALNAGRDPHSEIAADISGWSYEQIRAVYEAGKEHPDYQRVYDWRQTGKVVDFGCAGGLGPERLCHFAQQSYGVILTPERAKWLKYEVWAKRWTEMPEYFRRIDFAIEQHGAIEQLYSGRRRGDVSYCDACNGMFQGLAADIAKDAGFELARACYVEQIAGARIVNFIHDEWVVEVPETEARDYSQVIRHVLINAAARWLPDVMLDVEVTACRRYKGDDVALH
jgi:DNA polymerase-1